MGNRTNFKQCYDLLLGLSRCNNYTDSTGCWFLQLAIPNCVFLGIRFHKRKMSTCNPCSSFLLQINQHANKCFVWENEDGVMRRGHKKPEEILPFPQDSKHTPPTDLIMEGPGTLTGTFWVPVVTRSTLVTVLSSVVGCTDTLAARTTLAVGHASAVTRAAWR